MFRKIRKLFIVIQPLQYLQALELHQENEERILIALWANQDSQLHKLVCEEDWNKVIWLDFRGTAKDIISNCSRIQTMLNELGNFDEVILSSYYNEFMNLIANKNPNSSITLLEDGNATLMIEQSSHYKNRRFKLKRWLCYLFRFDINPVNDVTLFTLSRSKEVTMPSIVKDVRINEFRKIREEVNKYEKENSVYFISSSFISVGMLTKETYISFIKKLADRYSEFQFNIILHRFDNIDDFKELRRVTNINLLKSDGPVELYFKERKILPEKIITAGSGATETLNLIYGLDIDVAIPSIECFTSQFQDEMKVLSEHLKHKYTVSFL